MTQWTFASTCFTSQSHMPYRAADSHVILTLALSWWTDPCYWWPDPSLPPANQAHPEEWAVEKAAEEAAAAEAALNAPLIKQETEDGEPVAGPSTDPDLPLDGLGAHSEDSESITERAPLIEDEFDEEAECEEIDEDVAMNIEVERVSAAERRRRPPRTSLPQLSSEVAPTPKARLCWWETRLGTNGKDSEWLAALSPRPVALYHLQCCGFAPT